MNGLLQVRCTLIPLEAGQALRIPDLCRAPLGIYIFGDDSMYLKYLSCLIPDNVSIIPDYC